MGLSASQGRLLCLTSRKSDIEYKAQQIAHRRINLANSMQDIQDEYTKRMNNTVLKFRNVGSSSYSLLTYYEFLNNEAFKGMYYLTNQSNKKVVASAADIPEGADESEYFIDEQLTEDNNSYFEKCLQDGVYYITQDGVQRTIAELSQIKEEYDDTDDPIAKAEYDSKMKTAERQDKELQLESEMIETEHQAIQTEMDSIKKIVDQNVENSYKTFG